MTTKAELSTDVLRQMAVIASNESPSSEDAAFVERAYDTKLAEWRRLGFVWWANTSRTTDEIPAEVVGVLTDLLENETAGAFGKSSPATAEKRETERILLRALRAINHKPPSGEQTPISSY